MKRFFSYGLLAMILLLSITVIYTPSYEQNSTTTVAALNRTVGDTNVDSGHTLSIPSEKDFFFMPPNMPASPLAINNGATTCVPAAYARMGGNTYHLLKSCFSLLNNQHFFITQSTYISQYARKVKEGYYLYALRQLRI